MKNSHSEHLTLSRFQAEATAAYLVTLVAHAKAHSPSLSLSHTLFILTHTHSLLLGARPVLLFDS